MFRKLVLLNNAVFMSLLVFMTIKEPPNNIGELFFVSLFYIFAAINITYSYIYTIDSARSESWISLYFKRRKLEEKKKIEELERNDGNL